MRLKTNHCCVLCIVLVIMCLLICLLFFKSVYSSPVLGEGTASVGDVVEVRVAPLFATGKVVAVTEKFDNKHGSYACYRVDFGILEDGQHDTCTIPFRFVKKVKNGDK